MRSLFEVLERGLRRSVSGRAMARGLGLPEKLDLGLAGADRKPCSEFEDAKDMKVRLIAVTPDSERVIEDAGRTCYQSCAKGGPECRRAFIEKVIRNGHHSVLEHAYATFRVTGVSRSFSHQLVRHRLCAFSQQSQRRVSGADVSFVEPPAIAQCPEAHRLFRTAMAAARAVYRELRGLGIVNEDARFVLPNATQTEIVMSANFRELRHIFSVRCDGKAQWEIRAVALQMLSILRQVAPSVFADFVIDEETQTASTDFSS